MAVKNKTDEIILEFLKSHPQRLADIRHHAGVSDFGCLHRLNRLEIAGVITAVRDGQKSTVYSLAPANEKKENENGDGETSPSREDTTNVSSNKNDFQQ
jgi:predicted transcriptional regulator